MKAWYAVYTRPNAEIRAAHNLMRQSFDVYLPQYARRTRHARRTGVVRSAFFPRYLFVNLDSATDRWRSVNSTFGAIYLICNGEVPARVPDDFIAEIKAREDDGGLIKLNSAEAFVPGQNIEILTGAFAGQTGIFECVSDESRVRILLDVLGRAVHVRLPNHAIGACG